MPIKLDYKNPAATATMIIEKLDRTFVDPKPQIYLVERKHKPFRGCWALPGGFLNCDKETLEEAAVRELEEETSLVARKEDLELLCVNSSPKRDPRGHVIDHVYIVKKYIGEAKAADDAADLRLFYLDNLPPLAFDHADALEKYKQWRLR